MRCRHCNRPLDEIEPGLYDECERCAAEGMWQCDVEIVEDEEFDDDDVILGEGE